MVSIIPGKPGWTKALLASVAAILLLPLGVVLFSGRWIAERLAAQETGNLLRNARNVMEHLREMETRELEALADEIRRDASVEGAFLRRDREALSRAARPYLGKSGGNPGDVHIAFLAQDKEVFLRAHAPESHGDQPRMATQEAAHPGGMTSGIELGPGGELVVRVVKPWHRAGEHVAGEHVGYVATARRMKNVAGRLRMYVAADVLFLVGNRIVASAGDPPSAALAARIAAAQRGERPASSSAEVGGVTYGIGLFPVRDAAGQTLGEMVILFDRTAATREVSRMLVLHALAATAGGMLLFALFFLHVRRLDARLAESHGRLEAEIGERARVGEALAARNAFLDKVIESLPHPFSVIDAATYEVVVSNTLARCGAAEGLHHCHELSHGSPEPCADDLHPCPLAAVRRDGRPVVVEHVHAVAGGGARQFEVHGYPVVDTGGNLTQMIEYCIDVTDRRRLEAEKERMIAELREALAQVKALRGMLPICASCKKIRDDGGYWQTVEKYVMEHSDATFTHGICPDCARRLYPGFVPRGARDAAAPSPGGG